MAVEQIIDRFESDSHRRGSPSYGKNVDEPTAYFHSFATIR